MKKVLVSGLANIETNVKVGKFPIDYFPICYPSFGVNSNIGGVGYNLAKSFSTLAEDVSLISLLGNDLTAQIILDTLQQDSIKTENIRQVLKGTPSSVVLHSDDGKRQIYSDLKDIQDAQFPFHTVDISKYDLIVACNVNFNRPLLRLAREANKLIATDVHVLRSVHDDYNKEFMSNATILFLSDEGIQGQQIGFVLQLKDLYPNLSIIVVGLGKNGALLYERRHDKLYSLSAVYNKNVVNTIGAGDALFSSFLHFYLKNDDALYSLKLAEVFASRKISYNGASNGFYSESETLEASSNISINVQELIH